MSWDRGVGDSISASQISGDSRIDKDVGRERQREEGTWRSERWDGSEIPSERPLTRSRGYQIPLIILVIHAPNNTPWSSAHSM